MVPDSIFDRSSTSFTSRSSKSVFDVMICLYSSISSFRSVFISRLEKPMMALSGVRISWLMLARKADLSLSDSSARSLASLSSLSSFLVGVTLRRKPV